MYIYVCVCIGEYMDVHDYTYIYKYTNDSTTLEAGDSTQYSLRRYYYIFM